MWGSPGERESQVDTSLASQKVTFGQTWTKKRQWGRVHTCFDLNRTFESHPASWCPCRGRRRITPENANCHCHKNRVCLFCLQTTFNSLAWGSLQVWATWRQRGRPGWRWRRGSPWILLSQQNIYQDEVNKIGPPNQDFIPNAPFVLKIALTHHLFSRTPKNLGFSPGAAVSVSIFRLYKRSLTHS